MNDDINQKTSQRKQKVYSKNTTPSIADTLAKDTEQLTDYQLDDPNVISLDELEVDTDNTTNVPYDTDYQDPRTPPSVSDAQSISGHMPDPDTDDDILASAQAMGIGLDADEENPQELNIAKAVERAEKEHWDN